MTTDIDVLVISDVICPWCQLGRKRFQQAADELLSTTGVRSRVQFAPWELAPSLPRLGVSKHDSYVAKFRRSSRDPEGSVQKLREQMTQLFEAEGLQYCFEASHLLLTSGKVRNDGATASSCYAAGVIGPTRDAHRLSTWALDEHGEASQIVFMDQLFHKYHAQGFNPADRQMLLAAAETAGLDLQRAGDVIDDSTMFDKSVSEAIDFAKQQLGVTGVPHFVIHDPISNISIQVPGAQDASTFANLLSRLVKKREPIKE